APRRWVDTAARIVSEALAPAIIVTAVVAAVAWDSTDTAGQAVVWSAVCVLFSAVIPMGFVLGGVRAGRWEDHHVADRARRRWPLVVGAVSVGAGTVLVLALGGPTDLVTLGVTMGAVLAVVWVVTDRWSWKVSVHALAAAVGASTATALGGWAGALVAWPLALLVGWSRVRLRAHTPGQVGVGALLGAAAMAAFLLLR
ncbi:phosphatase PAP2 family protein, partial [Nocardiopsis lucentensis]|uniref:hypothetical protein n=1 Tax=Nocardiopsis lucentensis TaxID=53441 RepID=UPI00038117E6